MHSGHGDAGCARYNQSRSGMNEIPSRRRFLKQVLASRVMSCPKLTYSYLPSNRFNVNNSLPGGQEICMRADVQRCYNDRVSQWQQVMPLRLTARWPEHLCLSI